MSARTLEDVVILGRAAPQSISDGSLTTCTGAWSKHRGFIRLYPCDPEEDLFSRWDIIDVDVRRNPKDSRDESWRLAYRDQPSCVEQTGEYPRRKRATLLTQLEDECVEIIKNSGRSLGIIQPDSIEELYFKEWEDEDDETTQTKLFEEMEDWRPETREEFDQEIRIKFTCPSCETQQGYHDKTLLEWGGYLATRKHDIESADELEGFYDLNNQEYNHWIFVGNQKNRPSAFIAINIIQMKNDVPIHNPFVGEYPKVSEQFVHPAERD
jgi:hypothetical protein